MQSFWLLLEIIDIVTDFIAVDNVLKYSFLSRFFTVYIVLVSLATVLSVIVIYYRGRALYDVRMFSLEHGVSAPECPFCGFSSVLAWRPLLFSSPGLPSINFC